jgi:cell division protein FtsI (penicillin-binding protein 3)
MIRLSTIQAKIRFFAYFILFFFIILILRIIYVQAHGMYERAQNNGINPDKTLFFRHSILDRNGNILAISVPAYEYHINPSFIIDVNVIIKKVLTIFPDLDESKLKERLSGNTNGWFLIKNGVTPEQKEQIISSGIEGSFFREYYTRFYPYNKLFSHIVGYTLKNEKYETGFKGIEKSMDNQLLQSDVILSLDATIQNIIYDALEISYNKYKAKGAFAILVDLETREIISSVSLPSFDPSGAINPNSASHVNIPFSSIFNLGSVFKIFTISLALQNNFKPKQEILLPRQIPVTSTFSVTDEHRSRDIMTLEEVLAYSSNVGVALITQKVGFEKQRTFFNSLKIFEKPQGLELPQGEIAKPLFVQGKWRESMHYTASYGYGISLAPIHFLQIVSGLVYDGKILPLTLLKKNHDAKPLEDTPQILNTQNIVDLQEMMRSVVTIGTARRATINGYSICGKTGTSLKFDGNLRKWSNRKKFLSFFSVFPCNSPKYAMYIGIDEPTTGNVAGLQAWNTVVEVSADIVKVVAPMLNTKPDKDGNH